MLRRCPTARVYEVTLAPGAASDVHTHAGLGLTVVATSGMLEDEGSGPVAKGGTGAGSWSWRKAGYRHVLRNVGTTTVIVYEIDWR